jgi:hypothetical protein
LGATNTWGRRVFIVYKPASSWIGSEYYYTPESLSKNMGSFGRVKVLGRPNNKGYYTPMVEWLFENKEWLFSGIGITIIGLLWFLIKRFIVPEKPNLKFVVKSKNVDLSNGGIESANGEFLINPELIVYFKAQLYAHNPGPPTSAKLAIASIGPDRLSKCLSKGILPDKIGIKVEYKKNPNWGSIKLENPFIVENGDKNIYITAKIPFCVVEIEKSYGALALLKDMTVTLRAEIEATQKKLSLEPIHCDLTPVHQQIEHRVVSMIPQYQVRSNQKINTEQLVQMLKQYWLGEH